MIIRKPYAFLIKYFKIIHIILFISMTFLLFKTRNIYMFFREYLLTGTYIYTENMVFQYVSIPMILVTILLVAILLLIYFLMRQKQKPVFYYLSSVIFYFITFISFLVFLNFFNNLEFRSYSNQVLVIFRDLTMVLYYLNYLFLAVAFARGFGFNVKKFNFERDIKELDITESDREEIEVGGKLDYDNVFNFFRRHIRQLKYYFKENSFVLIVFLVIIVLGGSAYITLDKLVFNKTYQEMETIVLNDISYTVNNSYITNKDKYGEYVKNKDTYYLIIDFNVLNQTDNSIKLTVENYRVKMGNNYYYPKSNIRSKFTDLGTVYNNQNIAIDSSNRYILVFEIGEYNNQKITFQLYYGKKVSDTDATLYYKDISLNPNTFPEISLGSYQLTDNVNLENTFLKISNFSVNSYEVLDVFNYTYTKCDNEASDGACTDYNASITPSIGKKILKIEYSDSENNKKVLDYLNIEYQVNGRINIVESSSLKDITPDNCGENIFLVEIPSGVNLTDGKFVFEARNVLFEYVL